MKVVLFCGGLGTRIKEHSGTIPKPMIDVGYRPLMWYLMRYYAHYGHKEFILCLGYKGDYIKEYFLKYNECHSNDFQLSRGGREIQLYNSDIEDWKISFIDTGLNSNIGQRLLRVKEYLGDDEWFLANYSDGLTSLDFNYYLNTVQRENKIASFLSVKPSQSFHTVTTGKSGQVTNISPIENSDIWINGGFFVFKRDIFEYLREGEELVHEPFHRLIHIGELYTIQNPGFWACIDTLKEKQMFDEMYASGDTPWVVWDQRREEPKDPKKYHIPQNGYLDPTTTQKPE